MHWVAFIVAFIVAFTFATAGFLWAIVRIHITHRAVSNVFSDCDELKNPLPLWILFVLFMIASAFAGVLTISFPKVKNSSEAIHHIEIHDSENDSTNEFKSNFINEFENDLTSNSTNNIMTNASVKNEVSSKGSSSNLTSKVESKIEPIIMKDETDFVKKRIDSRIEEMHHAVIRSLISGSVKHLESVANKGLLDQFTLNPFAFTRLQQGLKRRLLRGYERDYLDFLKTQKGAIFLWKIKTRQPGPDILARLAVEDGKVAGFWFDGI